MASIEAYELADGSKRYRVRYRKPDHSSTDKRGFKRKKDAEDYLHSLAKSLTDGDYVDPQAGKVTVRELAVRWLKVKQAIMKPSSYHSIDVSWRVWCEPQWGGRAVGGIRKSEMAEWIAELTGKRSASIVLRAHGVMKGIFALAKDDGAIRSNPAIGLKNLPKKGRKARHYLSAQQVVALADASGEHRALVLVLGLCGLRWGEAIGLKRGDIDLERRRISVQRSATWVGGTVHEGTPKSGKMREVPMPGIVAEALRQQCEGKGAEDLVFTNADGGYLRQQSSAPGNRGWFRNALIAADLPMMTPHDLRHSAASIAVHNGANVKVLQRMLGHASAAMTLDTYADLFDSDLNDIADAIDAELDAVQGR